eukprot:CAMPEP_0174843308 /NCGR_PEP_ID=MMETSP1114-20130205/10433_1 /TAXON_ID=312471 /ORGANISM="Neobodo designis, Strain CCAP 1951/1" /LENGTH=196 /DNA_ID=CAMNT_0016077523 /DNA_START=68 /DNA_END=659 /DNA_ORIENTATION=-
MVCSSLGARLVVVVAGRVLEEIVLEDGLAALVALGAVLALVLGEALALVELEPRRGRQLDEAACDRLLALAARHLGRLGREVRVLARRVQRAAVGRLEVVLLFDALAAEGARDDLAELLPTSSPEDDDDAFARSAMRASRHGLWMRAPSLSRKVRSEIGFLQYAQSPAFLGSADWALAASHASRHASWTQMPSLSR